MTRCHIDCICTCHEEQTGDRPLNERVKTFCDLKLLLRFAPFRAPPNIFSNARGSLRIRSDGLEIYSRIRRIVATTGSPPQKILSNSGNRRRIRVAGLIFPPRISRLTLERLLAGFHGFTQKILKYNYNIYARKNQEKGR